MNWLQDRFKSDPGGVVGLELRVRDLTQTSDFRFFSLTFTDLMKNNKSLAT